MKQHCNWYGIEASEAEREWGAGGGGGGGGRDRDRHTDRGRQTDRQRQTQADRRQTDRQTDRQKRRNVEWTLLFNAEIGRKKFPAVDEACVSVCIVWPISRFKGRTFDILRLSTKRTLISASAVPRCVARRKRRRRRATTTRQHQ